MAHLPVEILLVILSDFSPPALGELCWPTIRLGGVYEESQRVQRQYSAQLQLLASLRLVCSRWYEVITPTLYSTFVFIIFPPEVLQRHLIVFQKYPHLIQHLVLLTRTGASRHQTAGYLFQDAEIVEACLGQCTKLRTLQLINVEWLFLRIQPKNRLRIFQSNQSNLTSVIIGNRNNDPDNPRIVMTTALAGLGSEICNNLTNLEIFFHWSPDNHSAKLPSSFPNLSRLVLGWYREFPPFFLKLASRITRKSDSTGNAEKMERNRNNIVIPLRELVLYPASLSINGTEEIIKLLEINGLGRSLTSLHFRTSGGNPWYGDSTDGHMPYALRMLNACPSLTAFHYFSFFPPSLFSLLPGRLEEVGLQVMNKYSRSTLQNLGPVIDWIRSPGSTVKKVLVGFVRLGYDRIFFDVHLEFLDDWKTLEEECAMKGISLQIFRS